jgi:hypothetical protein
MQDIGSGSKSSAAGVGEEEQGEPAGDDEYQEASGEIEAIGGYKAWGMWVRQSLGGSPGVWGLRGKSGRAD